MIADTLYLTHNTGYPIPALALRATGNPNSMERKRHDCGHPVFNA
jgi:hypothetical protein